jgi:hypothetical protein
MNFKQRLKKLESIVIDDSEFCACFPQRVETYIQDLGENATDNEPKLTNALIPGICPECGRRTEKHSITVQLVDGTTKDRFPDEWKSYNGK